MNFSFLKILTILLIGSSIFSCTFENEEDYFGVCEITNENGDTLDFYYSDVKPVFEGICSNCHNSVSTYREGIVLDSYTNVKNTLDNYSTKVINAITHKGPFKMPLNQQKLTECEINKILIWFNNDMPENKN